MDGLNKVVAQVLLLRAGKGKNCLGIELPRHNHGGKPVKVGVEMGGDDFHAGVLFSLERLQYMRL